MSSTSSNRPDPDPDLGLDPHRKPASPLAAPEPADTVGAVEDAGSRALAEALSSSFRIVKVLMVILVIAFFGSGIFEVKPNENAVVLRFGKPVGATEADQLRKPGFNWAFPKPIDEIVTIPVGESHTIVSSAGWYAYDTPGVEPPPMPYLRPGVDGYTLTSDGNIIHVRATIKYRISNPMNYAFRFANATNLLQNVVNNAIYHASARYTAEAALYRDQTGFKEAVLSRILEKVNAMNLGITVEASEVISTAPLEVRQAFDEVVAAEQERSTRINQARGEKDEITRKAIGEAQAIISDGVTASNRLVQAISADASSFLDQLPYYRKAPKLFTERIRTETLARVLTNSQDKFFLRGGRDGTSRELRLQLNREPLRTTLPQSGTQAPR